MPRLCEADRAALLQLHREGQSARSIARHLHCCDRTVRETIRRHQQTGRLRDRPRSGRPSVISEHLRRRIVRESLKNRFKTASDLHRELPDLASCSVWTVRRPLLAAGLHGRVARRKPTISAKNRRNRLAFARTHLEWTPTTWHRTVFTDESKFNRLGSDGR